MLFRPCSPPTAQPCSTPLALAAALPRSSLRIATRRWRKVMSPQERQLIDDLFDRNAKLEMGPRDPEAERAIAAGAQRAPHALYALVQTALVQDEALKQA